MRLNPRLMILMGFYGRKIVLHQQCFVVLSFCFRRFDQSLNVEQTRASAQAEEKKAVPWMPWCNTG